MSSTYTQQEILAATIPCPNCGRRLRCSCSACMERWPESTNAPNLGFSVWVDECFESCNDCGHTMHCDEWLDIELAEFEYGAIAEGVIL